MTTDPPNHTPTPDALEQELSQLTQWTGGDTALWKTALERVDGGSVEAPAPIPMARGVSTSRRVTFWAGQLAAMLLVATLASIMAVSWTHTRPTPVTTHLAASDTKPQDDSSLAFARSGASDPASVVSGGTAAEEASKESLGSVRSFGPPHTDGAEIFGQSTNNVSLQHPGSAGSGYGYADPGVPEVKATLTDATHSRSLETPSPTSPPAPMSIAPAANEPQQQTEALASQAGRETSTRSGELRRQSDAMSKAEVAEQRDQTPAVRRVNVQIVTDDVRTAYVSATKIGTADARAPVMRSRFDAAATAEPATVMLTVPVSELDATLTTVRGLGKVTSESIDAEDLSEHVAVLDARIAVAEDTRVRSRAARSNERRAGEAVLPADAIDANAINQDAAEDERVAVLLAQRETLLKRAGYVEIAVTIRKP